MLVINSAKQRWAREPITAEHSWSGRSMLTYMTRDSGDWLRPAKKIKITFICFSSKGRTVIMLWIADGEDLRGWMISEEILRRSCFSGSPSLTCISLKFDVYVYL